MASNSNYDPYIFYRLRESCKEFVNETIRIFNAKNTFINELNNAIDDIGKSIPNTEEKINYLKDEEKIQRTEIMATFQKINTLLKSYSDLIFSVHIEKINGNVWNNQTNIPVQSIYYFTNLKYNKHKRYYAYVLNTDKYVKDGTTDVKYLRAAGKYLYTPPNTSDNPQQVVFQYELKNTAHEDDYYYTEITDEQMYDLLEKESVDVFEAKDSHSFKEGSYYACVLLDKCIDYKTCLRRNLTYLGKFINDNDGEIKFDKTKINTNALNKYMFVEVEETDADFNQDKVLATYELYPVQQPAQYGGRSKRNKKLNRNKTRRRIAKKLHA